eukprot:CAMPEP_0206186760 /NCGR_PEP_ID=MMETSP0166-20121206/2590_1 /ASSEMBLY_ACC=CAM_ASM_000260 /TAXON_ID=95228 /ORGANISM="Vannella robusta, Strain DIVA3 518/3/11/1/6" /LENGTH=264 /DNA_ID=CAMNT_0053602197 /DNA_START=856 /DNA_END=1647 /DNA_ORIENTATION=-
MRVDSISFDGEEIEIIQELQRGGSGTVYLATWASTKVAVKIVPFRKPRDKDRFVGEVVASEIVSQCPTVVDIFGHVLEDTYGCLIMKLHKGDLVDRVAEFTGEHNSKPVIKQICEAVQFCHSLGLAHLDIKPDNVLMDSQGNAYLCDFGHSSSFSSRALTNTGTHMYNPPEVHFKKFTIHGGFDKAAVDIWSLGVLMFVIITGNFPFRGTTEAKILREARRGKVCLVELGNCSSDCRDLIRKMLKVDPRARPTISQVLQHSWFQ